MHALFRSVQNRRAVPDADIGRPKKVRTAHEETAYEESRRAAKQDCGTRLVLSSPRLITAEHREATVLDLTETVKLSGELGNLVAAWPLGRHKSTIHGWHKSQWCIYERPFLVGHYARSSLLVRREAVRVCAWMLCALCASICSP